MKAHNSNKDKTRLCFLLLCAVSLVCSCSREDDLSVDSEPVEAAFSGSFVREEWSDSGRDDSGRAGTRVSDAAWTVGDAVGVYMVPGSSYDLTGAVWKNRKQVIDSENKMTPDGSANKLYYPLNGSDVRFVAYYPYATSPTHPDSLNTVSVDFSNQSTKPLKEAKDFMFHRGNTNYSKANPNASLGFSHKFSKILMTVNKGDGGPSLSDLAVTLKGMPKSATVYLDRLSQRRAVTDADSIAVGEAGDIAAFTHDGATETSATVEAIVAPHKGEGTGGFSGRTFTFDAGGETKIYELPDTVTFKSGYAYHFTFSLASGTQVSDGMTNCYMVVPGGEVSFKVSRAYTYVSNAFTDTLHVGGEYTGTFTAEVLWDDNSVINTVSVSGSGNAAKVTVKTNNKEGNAVVAIKKGSDIVWSYHIWVTNYDPTINTWTNPNQTAHTYMFMDRNLGATEAALSLAGRGLFYQWGRKDPFPGGRSGVAGFAALNKFSGINQSGAGSTTSVTVSSSNNADAIVESIQKPTTFYKDKMNGNWLPDSPARNDTLWSTNGIVSGKKTIYDPCPAGWRVPARTAISASDDYSPWKGLASQSWTEGSDTGGVDWGDNAKYPAAGYRLASSGSIYFEGSDGRYWSASPYSSGSFYASHLYFGYSGGIYRSFNNIRADGFSVRCAQE